VTTKCFWNCTRHPCLEETMDPSSKCGNFLRTTRQGWVMWKVKKSWCLTVCSYRHSKSLACIVCSESDSAGYITLAQCAKMGTVFNTGHCINCFTFLCDSAIVRLTALITYWKPESYPSAAEQWNFYSLFWHLSIVKLCIKLQKKLKDNASRIIAKSTNKIKINWSTVKKLK